MEDYQYSVMHKLRQTNNTTINYIYGILTWLTTTPNEESVKKCFYKYAALTSESSENAMITAVAAVYTPAVDD